MPKKPELTGTSAPRLRPQGVWRTGFALAVALSCLLPAALHAATFTASLDRDTLTLGETINLYLTFNGGAPQQTPMPPNIPDLQIAYIGPSSQVQFINGQVSQTVTHNFQITPRRAGVFTIPALTVTVGSEKLSSQSLQIRVLQPNAPPPAAANSGNELALLKLVLPKLEGYVGETLVAQLQLYLRSGVQRIRDFQLTGFPADGCIVGKPVEGNHSQAQLGSTIYTVIPLSVSIKLLRDGPLTLGPVTATAVLELPGRNNQRRDPFEFPDISEFFGGRVQRQQVVLATETNRLNCLSLPVANRPANFNGAIGSYTLTMSVGPTNVASGDPITVKVQITGRGVLDALTLPDQAAWTGFKTYPPTTKVDTTDPLGLQGTKTFEQIVVPETAEVKALPGFSFSYFDPDKKAFQTLTQPAVPLVVRPGGSLPAPTVAAARSVQENVPPVQDIVQIKQRLGAVGQVSPALVQQRWFWATQTVPVVALLSAIAWRRRAENLANNPRLRRRKQVAQLVREGLQGLNGYAAANDSDQFFATLFRLLQEQLGERLDVPASSITEAVLDEKLRPKGVPETILAPLHEMFQTCNMARYAPIKSSQQLAAFVPRAETLLHDLAGLKV